MQESTKLIDFPFVNEATRKEPQSFFSGATEKKPVVFGNRGTHWYLDQGAIDITPESSSTLLMQSKILRIEKKVAVLESKVAGLEGCLAQEDAEVIDIRDIPYAQAKREIRQFFEDHHGENFDAVDIQDLLGIEIDLAIDVLEILREEGKIK